MNPDEKYVPNLGRKHQKRRLSENTKVVVVQSRGSRVAASGTVPGTPPPAAPPPSTTRDEAAPESDDDAATHGGADEPSAPPADYVDRGRRSAVVEATLPAAHREYLLSVSAHGCLGDPHAPGASPDAPEDIESLLPLPASPCVPAEMLPPNAFGPPPPPPANDGAGGGGGSWVVGVARGGDAATVGGGASGGGSGTLVEEMEREWVKTATDAGGDAAGDVLELSAGDVITIQPFHSSSNSMSNSGMRAVPLSPGDGSGDAEPRSPLRSPTRSPARAGGAAAVGAAAPPAARGSAGGGGAPAAIALSAATTAQRASLGDEIEELDATSPRSLAAAAVGDSFVSPYSPSARRNVGPPRSPLAMNTMLGAIGTNYAARAGAGDASGAGRASPVKQGWGNSSSSSVAAKENVRNGSGGAEEEAVISSFSGGGAVAESGGGAAAAAGSADMLVSDFNLDDF